MTSDAATFIREFARSPGRTGSVIASSRRLAEAAVGPVPESGDPFVVELGAGTGAFTAAIARRLDGRGHHLAVEVNDRFADVLRERSPDIDLAVMDTADLPRLLAERGVDRADVIVSGLPWSMFHAGAQRRLLTVVRDSLAADGAFTTFGYVYAPWHPAARRFRGMLMDAFEEVVTGRTIWRNFPPAFVYTMRRPRCGSLA